MTIHPFSQIPMVAISFVAVVVSFFWNYKVNKKIKVWGQTQDLLKEYEELTTKKEK
jgi:CHASE3 domain sensor protein